MARKTPKKLSKGQFIGLAIAVILIFAAYGAAKTANDNPSYNPAPTADSTSAAERQNSAAPKNTGSAGKNKAKASTQKNAQPQQPEANTEDTENTQGPVSPYAAARTALAALPDAATVAPAPAYERDEFGHGWLFKLNGCSTREEVLLRDLQNVTMRADRKCKVHTGTLSPDPYGGGVINFDSVQNPMTVQIDHIVPLKQAWYLGAAAWTPTQRVQFSNDTENLIAVSGRLNNSKSDKTPAQWLVPANPDFRCEYAKRYANVSAKYSLAIASADRQVLDATLAACG